MKSRNTSLSFRAAWLDAILRGRFGPIVSLSQLPGRIRLPKRWRAKGPLVGEHLFYYVAAGSFEALVAGSKFQAQAQDLLWIGPGVHFTCSLPEGDSAVLWRFRLKVKKSLGAPFPWKHLSDVPVCGRWVGEIIDEVTFPGPWQNDKLRGLLGCLFTEVFRGENRFGKGKDIFSPAQRERLIHYISEHAAEWPAPSALARCLELSGDYFARRFTRTFGRSPRRWLLEERIRMAALRLTESDLRITEVADELGYEGDVFLFSRQFKQVMGESPKSYRRNRTPTVSLGTVLPS